MDRPAGVARIPIEVHLDPEASALVRPGAADRVSHAVAVLVRDLGLVAEVGVSLQSGKSGTELLVHGRPCAVPDGLRRRLRGDQQALERLVRASIARRASVLLSQEVLDASLSSIGRKIWANGVPAVARAVSPLFLDRGISLERAVAAIPWPIVREGQPLWALAERLAGGLPPTLEVVIDEPTLRRLTATSSEEGRPIGAALVRIKESLGLDAPPVSFRIDNALAGRIAIRLNDVQLDAAEIMWGPGSAPLPEIDEPPSPAGLGALLENAVRGHAGWMLGTGPVSAMMSKLSPALRLAVLEALDVESITRLLRDLVDEGVSIHNLPFILEAAAEADSVPAARSETFVLDDRRAEAPPGADPGRRLARLAHVRAALKRQLTFTQSGGTWSVSGWLLRKPYEARLIQGELDDESRAALLTSLRKLGGEMGEGVILTDIKARPLVRALVAGELPALRIIALQEIEANASIVLRGRLP
jgi:hypothetical protein